MPLQPVNRFVCDILLRPPPQRDSNHNRTAGNYSKVGRPQVFTMSAQSSPSLHSESPFVAPRGRPPPLGPREKHSSVDTMLTAATVSGFHTARGKGPFTPRSRCCTSRNRWCAGLSTGSSLANPSLEHCLQTKPSSLKPRLRARCIAWKARARARSGKRWWGATWPLHECALGWRAAHVASIWSSTSSGITRMVCVRVSSGKAPS